MVSELVFTVAESQYRERQWNVILNSCNWTPRIGRTCPCHDDVIKWKYYPRYWAFVRGIHWSPVNSPPIGQLRGALMFSLICAWINGWVNNRDAGDLRRHWDVISSKNLYRHVIILMHALILVLVLLILWVRQAPADSFHMAPYTLFTYSPQEPENGGGGHQIQLASILICWWYLFANPIPYRLPVKQQLYVGL